MLLTEVVASAKQIPHPEDPGKEITQYDIDWEKTNKLTVSGIYVDIEYTYEETQILQQVLGPDWSKKIQQQIPVAYGFAFNKDAPDAQGLMDALKNRKTPIKKHMRPTQGGGHEGVYDDEGRRVKELKYTMSPEDRKEIMVRSLNRFNLRASNDRSLNKKQNDIAYGYVQNILKRLQQSKSTNDAVVVELSSSSSPAQEFAELLSQTYNIPLIPQAFSKAKWPSISKFSKENDTWIERPGITDDIFKHDITTTQGKIEAAIEELMQLEDEYDNKKQTIQLTNTQHKSYQQKIDKYYAYIKNLENRLKYYDTDPSKGGYAFQIKKIQGRDSLSQVTDRGKGIYNLQQFNSQVADQFNDKIVILVDDNIASGHSLQDAAKSIYKSGAIPKRIIAVAMHYYS